MRTAKGCYRPGADVLQSWPERILVAGRLAIIECYDVTAGSYHDLQSEAKEAKNLIRFFTERSGLRH